MRGHTRWRGKSIEVLVYLGKGRYQSKTVRWQGGKKATQDEADRQLRKMLDDLGDTSGDGENVTVRQLVTRWRQQSERDWSPSTVAAYDSYLRLHILPALGDKKIRAVTTFDLDDFYTNLAATLSPASVGKCHVIIRRAFGEAERWRWISRNPASDARPPRVEEVELKPPTSEQVRSLLDLALHGRDSAEKQTKVKADPTLYTYVVLAADTGARRGELVAVRWGNVDLEAGELLIDRALSQPAKGPAVEKGTKTRQNRRVALGAPCVHALKDHRRRMAEQALTVGAKLTDDSYVFALTLDGSKPWRPDGATSRFIRLRDAAGLPNVRLHDLRHALVSDWLAAGVDQRTVMGRVGHASLQTLTRYAHFVHAADREAADRLAERHSG